MTYKYSYLRNATEFFNDIHSLIKHYDSFLDVGGGECLLQGLLRKRDFVGFDTDPIAITYCLESYDVGSFFVESVHGALSNKYILKDYDCLLLINIPFLLNKDLLRDYVNAFKPRSIIMTGIITSANKLRKLRDYLLSIGYESSEEIIKEYNITNKSHIGKPVKVLNERIIIHVTKRKV